MEFLNQLLHPFEASQEKLPAEATNPVMLPSGRAMLHTRPLEVGSPPPANTIGMTDVRC
jgi:hypothetical protein